MCLLPSIEEIKDIEGNESLTDHQALEIAEALRELIVIGCKIYINKIDIEDGRVQTLSKVWQKERN